MKLSAAASYFDRLELRDGYSNARLGKGQLDLFDDSRRDGIGAIRRILSITPKWVAPARRVISFDKQAWIVGGQHPDVFSDKAIRRKFVLHPSDGLCSVLTGFELLGSLPGLQVHASRAWFKDTKDISVTAELQSQYLVYLADGEPVSQGMFVKFPDAVTLIIHNSYRSVAGFLTLECSELEPTSQLFVELKQQKAVYDPVTETYATVTPSSIPAIVTRFLDDYQFRNERMSDAYVGDLRVRVRVVDAPQVQAGDALNLSSKPYRVLSVEQKPDATFSLHVRPA